MQRNNIIRSINFLITIHMSLKKRGFPPSFAKQQAINFVFVCFSFYA
jgi:hypothetical protein